MNASGRLNTCKSRGSTDFGLVATGKRVRNTYATYPLLEDSPEKFGLTLHSIFYRHLVNIKNLLVKDWRASH